MFTWNDIYLIITICIFFNNLIYLGFYPPTSGDAIINGYRLTTELEMIQKSLGICTQNDILYPYLTFDENVRFFGWVS